VSVRFFNLPSDIYRFYLQSEMSCRPVIPHPVASIGGFAERAMVVSQTLHQRYREQRPKIAGEIERAYFQVLGWQQAKVAKKPSLGTKEADKMVARRIGSRVSR
jgi:hypothetical protein